MKINPAMRGNFTTANNKEMVFTAQRIWSMKAIGKMD